MRHLFLISTVAFALLTVFGCSKSKDKEEVDAADPVISVTSPTDDQIFQRGGNNYIQFSGVVSDDMALKELEVTLEWHGETKSTEIDGDGTVTAVYEPWETQTQTISLTGKSQSFTQKNLFDKPIPDNIQDGFYVLTFVVTDGAEKSFTVIRTIQII